MIVQKEGIYMLKRHILVALSLGLLMGANTAPSTSPATRAATSTAPTTATATATKVSRNWNADIPAAILALERVYRQNPPAGATDLQRDEAKAAKEKAKNEARAKLMEQPNGTLTIIVDNVSKVRTNPDKPVAYLVEGHIAWNGPLVASKDMRVPIRVKVTTDDAAVSAWKVGASKSMKATCTTLTLAPTVPNNPGDPSFHLYIWAELAFTK
jgi:hypothetical protein